LFFGTTHQGSGSRRFSATAASHFPSSPPVVLQWLSRLRCAPTAQGAGLLKPQGFPDLPIRHTPTALDAQWTRINLQIRGRSPCTPPWHRRHRQAGSPSNFINPSARPVCLCRRVWLFVVHCLPPAGRRAPPLTARRPRE
jgi:hypothetical protein